VSRMAGYYFLENTESLRHEAKL